LARIYNKDACENKYLPPKIAKGDKIFSKMKAKVFVTLKKGVLDPQGKAIQHSVELLGYERIRDLRQGKYFEIELEDSCDEEIAREEIGKMAREVLSNPVIEDYRVVMSEE